MENQHTGDVTSFEKFTWTIKNFSKLDTEKLYSETFFISGYQWRILLHPKGNKTDDHLSIYLDTGDVDNLPKGWSRFANFKLVLINQVDSQNTITKETKNQFNAREPNWGWQKFVTLTELHNSSSGFIMRDTCMIEAVISIQKLDFKSFGKIDEAFVPFLEEVCSWHPSLMDCQQHRSRTFTEWSFTALGRVLHFLKTTKLKDMNEDACSRHLQLLWEELEACKFDLTWLQPHIQSALSMESYIETSVQLNTMKEKVAALDMESKLLKEKISTIEGDLDVVLGYGGPT